MNKCSVCGRQAEVSHPDGYGGQTYYCGVHEPDTLLDVLREEEETDDSTIAGHDPMES
jgi:hypothetical protein